MHLVFQTSLTKITTVTHVNGICTYREVIKTFCWGRCKQIKQTVQIPTEKNTLYYHGSENMAKY